MAGSYYEGLPIYRAAVAAAVKVDRAVQRFGKGHKYTLGARLREQSADIVVLVARANRREERARTLAVALEMDEAQGNVKHRRLTYLLQRIDSNEEAET